MRIEPNWASSPGATIARVMKTREIEPSDFADAVGLNADEFDALLHGKLRLSEKLAEALAEQLGSTARFWLARDKDYLKELARLGAADGTAIDQWAQSMPVASMKRLGWLPMDSRTKLARNDALLSFFDCKSIQDWGQRYSAGVGAVAFRTSLTFASDGMATLVWLRAGEAQLASRPNALFDREEFRRILPSLKRLSAFKHPATILQRLRDACALVGVSITTARAPEGCRASGASWFDADGRPVIHLSFRHLSEDHFWFTFFHEAAHVILHGHSHIDSDGVQVMGEDTEKQEDEANAYAQEILLPDDIRQDILGRQAVSAKAILHAAKVAKVTAGVIVGQLEKAKVIRHGKFLFLKHRYRWGASSYVPDLIAG
jgi:HTH-type transcriptional regulator / antitoxin HigA